MSFSKSSRLSVALAGASGGTGIARSRGTRPFERLRFNSPPEPGHAPSRFLRRGVPLPARLNKPLALSSLLAHSQASWAPFQALSYQKLIEPRSSLRGLAERMVLPSIVRRRSWGSPLRRFIPASGGIASLHSRAHLPFAPLALTRLIFVGVIALARSAS